MLGTQIGLALMVVVLTFGFAVIVERMAAVFDIVRVLGAAYLMWLGWKLWRADGATLAGVDEARDGESPAHGPTGSGYVLQGFLVIWSNPKALFFFGAFIPQFVDPGRPAAAQVLVLGAVFMAVGTLLDAAWALLAARLSRRIGRRHARLVERGVGHLPRRRRPVAARLRAGGVSDEAGTTSRAGRADDAAVRQRLAAADDRDAVLGAATPSPASSPRASGCRSR